MFKEKGYKFVSKISIPGIPSIFNTENLFFKLLWIVLVLTSFAVGFYNISDLTNAYYSYEVVTKVVRVSEKNFTLPAITICIEAIFWRSYYRNNTFISKQFIIDRNNLSTNFFIQAKFQGEFLKSHLEFFTFPLNNQCLKFNGPSEKEFFKVEKPNEELMFDFITEYHEAISENEYFIYKPQNDYFMIYIEDNFLNSFLDNFPLVSKFEKYHLIRIKKLESEKKLAEPYNNCTESTGDQRYHKMNCVESCIFKEMGNKFNCTWKESLFRIDGLNQCKESLIYDKIFFESIDFYKKYCDSQCPESCDTVKFDSEVSIYEKEGDDKKTTNFRSNNNLTN